MLPFVSFVPSCRLRLTLGNLDELFAVLHPLELLLVPPQTSLQLLCIASASAIQLSPHCRLARMATPPDLLLHEAKPDFLRLSDEATHECQLSRRVLQARDEGEHPRTEEILVSGRPGRLGR